ncbi:class I SAM-dependent methyltransferase [Actinoallomurus iriomotensis]|uniref:Similarity with UbiE/COQ5 methyltransferase n=1 Tax=Actinoallomurus iriomotensis TaxID=478107 RepID=A0A9W6S622_9ACTN|nr:methyltransferase domain-containing protein [Actinoallomurus iriomotensis]GLY86382.1 similarity with UbiE/COQ5 methyltransferase [Actinoallomurus iriomotensis]
MVADDALDRVLKLLASPPVRPEVSHGYLDLLGEEGTHDTLAQRLMRSSGLPRIYEQVWRPVLFGLAKGGPLGPSTDQEYALARAWLDLAATPGATVLDVACGPGNVTRALAEGVTDGGLVIGADASATMLSRAVADTPASAPGTAEVAYVRCDAADLPFADAAFDAVCCYGGLYLFADPWAALASMARVLRPGGRLVVLTTHRPGLPLLGPGLAAVSGATGIRMFGARELTEGLGAAGFSAVRRRSHGLMQLAGATRP